MPRLLNVCKYIAFVLLITLASTSLAASRSSFDLSLISYIKSESDINVANQKYQNLDLESDEPNLYFTIYNQTVILAEDQVYRGLEQVTGYDADLIRNFILFGDSKVFSLIKDPTTAAFEASNLTDLYKQEHEFFQNLATLENKTIAMEIFANGSKSDAGFDLLDDLENIEEILYNDVSPSAFGPTINFNDSRNMGITTSGILSGSSYNPVFTGPVVPPGNSSGTEGSSTSSGNQNPEQNLVCPVDPVLQNSLTDYNSEQNGDAASGDGTDPNSDPDPSNSSGPKNNLFQNLNPSLPSPFNPNPKKCPDGAVFCLRTESIYSTATSYFPADRDCLACELSKLSTSAKTLAEGNLTAQKVTGNFLEPNICKKVAFNRLFNFRVNILPRPVLPPQNKEDEVTETSPADIEATLSRRCSTSAQSGFATTSTSSSITRSGSIADTIGAEATASNFEDENCFLQTAATTNALNLDSYSNQTGGLSVRLESFTNYLSSLHQLTQEINETLSAIKSKPVCQ